MHTTDCDLLALLHGEPVWLDADEARRHIESCRVCAARQASLWREETEQRALLSLLDVPVPLVTVATIQRRAVARRRSVGIAASIVALVTVASAAVAFPGSPLRSWIWNTPSPIATAPALSAHRPGAENLATDGVEFPAVGIVVIELRYPQRSGQIRIVRTNSTVATARAIGGNVGFRVGSGRVILDNRPPAASYELYLPRDLIQASVLVGGRLLVRLTAHDAASTQDTLTFDLSLHSGRTP